MMVTKNILVQPEGDRRHLTNWKSGKIPTREAT